MARSTNATAVLFRVQLVVRTGVCLRVVRLRYYLPDVSRVEPGLLMRLVWVVLVSLDGKSCEAELDN